MHVSSLASSIDFDALVDEISCLLELPAVLEDWDFHLVAHGSQRMELLDPVRMESILRRATGRSVREWFESFGIASAEQPLRIPPNTELGITPRLCVPARSAGRTYGYFWLLEDTTGIDESLWPAAMEIGAQAGEGLARRQTRQGRLAEGLASLLTSEDDPSTALVEEVADLAGLRLTEPVTLVSFLMTIEERDRLREQARRVSAGVVLTHFADECALLASAAPAPRAAQPIVERALDLVRANGRLRMPIGVGGTRPLTEASRSWAQARAARRVAAASGGASTVRWHDLDAQRLLAVASDGDLVEAVMDDRLAAFVARGPSELVLTATTYLDLAGNAQSASRQLTIHRQTLYYRLAAIERHTGLDLTRGRDRLRLHLALQLGPVVLTQHQAAASEDSLLGR